MYKTRHSIGSEYNIHKGDSRPAEWTIDNEIQVHCKERYILKCVTEFKIDYIKEQLWFCNTFSICIFFCYRYSEKKSSFAFFPIR